jgi:peptidoglycan/xylan/chitin deacetylase (PgdA/CDA1 family)
MIPLQPLCGRQQNPVGFLTHFSARDTNERLAHTGTTFPMLTFIRHLIATKGPFHALERLVEIICRFIRGGRRFDRILDRIDGILTPRDFRITFFVTAGVIQRHSHRIDRLKRLGHEVGSHGIFHSRMDILDFDSQLEILRDSYRTLVDSGQVIRGFRSPYLNYNSQTREALEMSPYTWTSGEVILWGDGSSECASAQRLDELYSYRRSDEQLSLPTLRRRVLDIPITLPDDEMLYERLRIRDHRAQRIFWAKIFGEIHRRGELFHILFHPERFHRTGKAIGGVIDAVHGCRPGPWCTTLDRLADWWLRRSRWQWRRIDEAHVAITCPPEATILINQKDAAPGESNGNEYIYGRYRIHPTASVYPAHTITLSTGCPANLEQFLHAEGFLVERTDAVHDRSLYLDRCDFDERDARSLLAELETHPAPLLRVWRWPDAHPSAFCISADICAIDFWDFYNRVTHFMNHSASGTQRTAG